MESYQQRTRVLEDKHGKLIQVQSFNDEVLKNSDNEQYVKQIADIMDEEGFNLAYEAAHGLYQHYNGIQCGAKGFPVDRIDGLKLPFDDILNKTKRGRDADAYYRSHHGIDTVIGHPLGGDVSLALEKQYTKKKVITLMGLFNLNLSVRQL